MKLNGIDFETYFNNYPDERGYFGKYGGVFIEEKLKNAMAEINEACVRQQGIRVVRRLSGGGAVYHDLGNLNYTLIADENSDTMDFGRFCRPVIRALEACGVKAELNGRNDMTIEGQKFSGNAQYRKNGRIMHHGTLLFDSRMQMLAGALQVDEEKIKAKGVKSVRSRVTNIRPHLPQDMTLAEFRAKLLESILQEMPGSAYTLTEADLAAVEAIRQARYGTWEWNYGRSPACDVHKKRRFEGCGTIEVFLQLKQGRIEAISFRGDFFSPEDPTALASLLVGCPLEQSALKKALSHVDAGRYFHGLTTVQLIELLS